MQPCMMAARLRTMSNWSNYVKALTKGVGIEEVGARVGVSGSTISRWRSGQSSPKNPAEVALLAVAFDADVLEAFVAAGYLTPEQAQRPARLDLRTIPADLFNKELERRLTAGSGHETSRDDHTLAAKRGVDDPPDDGDHTTEA